MFAGSDTFSHTAESDAAAAAATVAAAAVCSAGLVPRDSHSAVEEFARRIPHEHALLQHQGGDTFLDNFGNTAEAAGIPWREHEKYSPVRLASLYVFFQVVRSQSEDYHVVFDSYEEAVRSAASKSRADAELFQSCDRVERDALLQFANSCALVLRYIPAKGNKQLYMSLIPMLSEGPQAKYVTGGGATAPTKRRMLLFDKLSGVAPAKRDNRPYNNDCLSKTSSRRNRTTRKSYGANPKPSPIQADFTQQEISTSEHRGKTEEEFYHSTESISLALDHQHSGISRTYSSEPEFPTVPFLHQDSDQWERAQHLEIVDPQTQLFDSPSARGGDMDFADQLLRNLEMDS